MNGDTILVGILGLHGHPIKDAGGLTAGHTKLETAVIINRAAGEGWNLGAQARGSDEVCIEQMCQNGLLSLGSFPPGVSALQGRQIRHCTSIAR